MASGVTDRYRAGERMDRNRLFEARIMSSCETNEGGGRSGGSGGGNVWVRVGHSET